MAIETIPIKETHMILRIQNYVTEPNRGAAG